MDINKIDIDLPKLICKTCDNLYYWDNYSCNFSKHQNKNGYLSRRALKKCDQYTERKGRNYNECKNVKCVFWCNDCEVHKSKMVLGGVKE